MHLLRGGGLSAAIDEGQQTLTIYDSERDERLLILPTLHLCLPTFTDQTPHWNLNRIEPAEGHLHLFFDSVACDVKVSLCASHDTLLLGSEITIKVEQELTQLVILPPATLLNLYDVVNFRNRHYTDRTWPELLLGGAGCETDTYSRDWQFAPHPSMLQLRKQETTLCLGAVDLPTAYGLYFAASDFTLGHCYLDYGSPGFGQELSPGTVFTTPRFCLFLARDKTPYEVTERYTGLLVQQGVIPDPKAKARYTWHREPVYCSWMDQGYIAGYKSADELGEQQLTGSNPTVEACTETLIHTVLDAIEHEKLPFRTILIDDGWQISRGQWEPEPQRFPDLRALVDDIHARGMKVIVWWNWAEVFDDAEVDVAHLAGGGWRNRHGRRVRDYSNPVTQSEYLEPLFRRFFSDEPGCYNFDGIKTDFLADKVHADMPLCNPEWRGEENYCYRTFSLFYSLMRRFKPDACHIGCAGNPYLAEFIDINRTYDVATSNFEEHVERARMLTCSTPGCPVSFDLHNFNERFREYFEAAKAIGASVHIGNILGMKRDRFSEWEPADDTFYEILRQGLPGTGKG